MNRPYSEHDIAAAAWLSIKVLVVVVLCTAAIVSGWPL